MGAKCAGDIMIPLDKYPHIPYWFTIRQAIAEMEMAELDVGGRKSLPRALLIFDEQYQLVGCVRRRDILARLEPRYLRSMSVHHQKKLFDVVADPDLADLSADTLAKAIQRQSEVPVKEIMRPISETVDINDHLGKIIYMMVNHDQNLLPVMKEGKVAGVVRSVDVFHEVAHIVL